MVGPTRNRPPKGYSELVQHDGVAPLVAIGDYRANRKRPALVVPPPDDGPSAAWAAPHCRFYLAGRTGRIPLHGVLLQVAIPSILAVGRWVLGIRPRFGQLP